MAENPVANASLDHFLAMVDKIEKFEPNIRLILSVMRSCVAALGENTHEWACLYDMFVKYLSLGERVHNHQNDMYKTDLEVLILRDIRNLGGIDHKSLYALVELIDEYKKVAK